MPTHEALVNTMIPQTAEKPLPVRTVITRAPMRSQNINQPRTNVDPVAADSATTADSVRLSPQITALARKEQAFRQREQAFKEREKALEAKLAEADQYSQLKDKFKAKDFSEAEALGLTYDEFTQYKLNQTNGEDPNAQAIKALESKIEALSKGQEEKATQEYAETVAAYKKELTSMATSDPAFAKVKAFTDVGADGKEFSGVDIATQFIVDSWEQDSEEVTVEEALKLTNDLIREKAKKWASLLDEEPKVSGAAGPGPLPPPKQGTRTLTQQMQPTGTERRQQKSLQHLSESERYVEARARALEKLKLEGKI